jgi:pimeloyl-ACP methyl ester carboxylesterase
MNIADTDAGKLAYRTFGDGKINIVVEGCLALCCAEWWHIAQKLSITNTTLVYDRAGYGMSSISNMERSPFNIAKQLHQLISSLETNQKLVLIGHSQGGLYVQQFARLFPERVRAVILIDPLSANDNKAKELLTSEEYKKSGFDKIRSYKMAYVLTKLGLGFLFRSLLKSAPPFYYYKDFSKEATDYILSSLTKSKHYKTAVSEYEVAHMEDRIRLLKSKDDFPEVPLVLITHTSKIVVEEIMKFGGLNRTESEKVENIWQDLMKEYLTFSPKSFHLQAEHSGHYIHLTEFQIVEKALAELGTMQ